MSQITFEELYDEMFDRVLNYAFRRTGDFDLANDITSDVFLKVYERLWTFKWRGIPVEIWVFRIANNELKQHYRRGKSRLRHLGALHALLANEVDQNTYETEREKAEELMVSHRKFREVRRAINQIDLKYQEVLVLRYFENFSIEEITQVTGRKVGTVKSQLSRGKELVRKILGVQPF